MFNFPLDVGYFPYPLSPSHFPPLTFQYTPTLSMKVKVDDDEYDSYSSTPSHMHSNYHTRLGLVVICTVC